MTSHTVQSHLGMCAQVLRQYMLLPEGEVRELEALAVRVRAAEAERAAEEELLADPPEEFVDALMDTLMEVTSTLCWYNGCGEETCAALLGGPTTVCRARGGHAV